MLCTKRSLAWALQFSPWPLCPFVRGDAANTELQSYIELSMEASAHQLVTLGFVFRLCEMLLDLAPSLDSLQFGIVGQPKIQTCHTILEDTDLPGNTVARSVKRKRDL